MDIFIEQLVKRKLGAADYLIIVGSILAGCVIIFLSMLVPVITTFVLVGVCFGEYYLITSRNVEYEYSVTNGDITVDKIIARRKRKRIISIDAHNVDAMGHYKSEEHKNKSYATRLFVSESANGTDDWYFAGNHPQKGKVLVVFSPNSKVLSSIKPFLARQVAVDAFGRN